MKNRYYSMFGLFVALGDGIEVSCQPNAEHFEISSKPLGWEWYVKNNYHAITRREFMDAYLPIAEKMNNKIAEL